MIRRANEADLEQASSQLHCPCQTIHPGHRAQVRKNTEATPRLRRVQTTPKTRSPGSKMPSRKETHRGQGSVWQVRHQGKTPMPHPWRRYWIRKDFRSRKGKSTEGSHRAWRRNDSQTPSTKCSQQRAKRNTSRCEGNWHHHRTRHKGALLQARQKGHAHGAHQAAKDAMIRLRAIRLDTGIICYRDRMLIVDP
jgi:hypothetical protein